MSDCMWTVGHHADNCKCRGRTVTEGNRMSLTTNQDRTTEMAAAAWNIGTVDERNSSTVMALWEIAHSLAAIADALAEGVDTE